MEGHTPTAVKNLEGHFDGFATRLFTNLRREQGPTDLYKARGVRRVKT